MIMNTCMSRLQYMGEITLTFQMANAIIFLHSGYFFITPYTLGISLVALFTVRDNYLNWMVFAFLFNSPRMQFSFSCASSMIISSFSAVPIEFIVLWNLFINSKIILFLPLTLFEPPFCFSNALLSVLSHLLV